MYEVKTDLVLLGGIVVMTIATQSSQTILIIALLVLSNLKRFGIEWPMIKLQNYVINKTRTDHRGQSRKDQGRRKHPDGWSQRRPEAGRPGQGLPRQRRQPGKRAPRPRSRKLPPGVSETVTLFPDERVKDCNKNREIKVRQNQSGKKDCDKTSLTKRSKEEQHEIDVENCQRSFRSAQLNLDRTRKNLDKVLERGPRESSSRDMTPPSTIRVGRRPSFGIEEASRMVKLIDMSVNEMDSFTLVSKPGSIVDVETDSD